MHYVYSLFCIEFGIFMKGILKQQKNLLKQPLCFVSEMAGDVSMSVSNWILTKIIGDNI